jgi:hypothetical protein
MHQWHQVSQAQAVVAVAVSEDGTAVLDCKKRTNKSINAFLLLSLNQ